MITLAHIVIAAICLLLALFVLAIVGLFIAMTGGADEILSHKNSDIIGDGAWEVPRQDSARIRDLPEPMGM